MAVQYWQYNEAEEYCVSIPTVTRPMAAHWRSSQLCLQRWSDLWHREDEEDDRGGGEDAACGT